MSHSSKENQLLHLAAVTAVIRASLSRLRHSDYDRDFQSKHLAHPMFSEMRDQAAWYAESLAAEIEAYNARACATAVLSGNFTNIWALVHARLGREDTLAPEMIPINSELSSMTESERLELVEHNQKMYLAVTVGYILCSLAAGKAFASGKQRVPIGEIHDATRTHLQRPVFAKLPKPVMSRIEFEIFEFVKEGLLNSGGLYIDAAQIGNHALFWAIANQAIGCGVSVEPMPISPELLPEDLYPAPEIIMKKKENALLHLALVVGYARLSRKSVDGVDPVTALTFAKAHLEFEVFRGLSENSRQMVADEIHMLAHDGNGTPDQGVALIEAAVAGKYGACWRLANERLRQREPSHSPVIGTSIDPAWLL